MKLGDKITDAFKGFKTFTLNDARILLSEKKKGISDRTIRVTLSRMAKKHRIYKVTKGVFSLQKRDEFAGFAFTPFYYGGLAALMIGDLIDDQVKMEVMTTRPVKRSLLEIYGGSSRIVLHHIPKKYYFGFEDVRYGDIIVPISDPEKTLIDLFYYKSRMSIQDYAELLKAVKLRKLRDYLKVYDNHTKTTVLNFVKKYKRLAEGGKLDNPY
jgi:predicted transcriptional regulator of viral defense system